MVGEVGLEPTKALASGFTVRPLCHSGHSPSGFRHGARAFVTEICRKRRVEAHSPRRVLWRRGLCCQRDEAGRRDAIAIAGRSIARAAAPPISPPWQIADRRVPARARPDRHGAYPAALARRAPGRRDLDLRPPRGARGPRQSAADDQADRGDAERPRPPRRSRRDPAARRRGDRRRATSTTCSAARRCIRASPSRSRRSSRWRSRPSAAPASSSSSTRSPTRTMSARSSARRWPSAPTRWSPPAATRRPRPASSPRPPPARSTGSPLVEVPNLARALDELGRARLHPDRPRQRGRGRRSRLPCRATAIALVLGAEGKGLRRLTRDTCDASRGCRLPARSPASTSQTPRRWRSTSPAAISMDRGKGGRLIRLRRFAAAGTP